MASIKPKPPERNPRRRRLSSMAENQITIINNVTIHGPIHLTLNEPPSGSQKNWLRAAITAILRTVLIIALFYA